MEETAPASFLFPIERGKVAEFARATFETHPAFFQPEAARAAGFDNIPVPLTYPIVSRFFQNPESTVRQYIQQSGFSWTIVLDATGEVARDYQIVAIPTSLFLDRDGIIRAVITGAMTKRAMEDELAEAMR